MSDPVGLVFAFAFIALLVETIVEIIKPLYVWLEAILDAREVPVEIDIVVALAISIPLTFLAKLSIFDAFGVPFESMTIAYIVTGLLLSKGSNFIHDLFEKLKK